MSTDQNQAYEFFLRKLGPVKSILSHRGPQMVVVVLIAYHILTTRPAKTAIWQILLEVGLYFGLFWVPVAPLRNQPVSAAVYRILWHRIGGLALERNKQVLNSSKQGISVRGQPVPRPDNQFKWLGEYHAESFDYKGVNYGIGNDVQNHTLSSSMYVMGQSQRLKDPVRQWPLFWEGYSNMYDQLPALGPGFFRFQTTTYTSIGASSEFNDLLKSLEENGRKIEDIPDFMLEHIWAELQDTAAQDTFFTLTIKPKLIPRKVRNQHGGRDVLVEMIRGLHRTVLPKGPSPIGLDVAIIQDANHYTQLLRRTLTPFEGWVNDGVPTSKAGNPQSVIHPDHARPGYANFDNSGYSLLGNGTLACSWYVDEYASGGMSFDQLAEFASLAIPSALSHVTSIVPDEVARKWAEFHKRQAQRDVRKKQNRELTGGQGPTTEEEVKLEAIVDHAEEVARGMGSTITEACYLTVFAKTENEMALYKRAVDGARRRAKLVLEPCTDEQWKGLSAALPLGRGLDTPTLRSLVRLFRR